MRHAARLATLHRRPSVAVRVRGVAVRRRPSHRRIVASSHRRIRLCPHSPAAARFVLRLRTPDGVFYRRLCEHNIYINSAGLIHRRRLLEVLTLLRVPTLLRVLTLLRVPYLAAARQRRPAAPLSRALRLARRPRAPAECVPDAAL
jgi:hypothetical protein